MRPTSTRQNDNQDTTLKDELYSIYVLEFQNRGVNYFHSLAMMPGISESNTIDTALESMLRRLAVNPSIFSIMLSGSPKEAMEDVLYGEAPLVDRAYITDLLDDMTLNVRLRNPELYDSRKDILMDQLNLIVKHQTKMSKEERKVFDEAVHLYEPILTTIHYLRKIGYNHALKDVRGEA